MVVLIYLSGSSTLAHRQWGSIAMMDFDADDNGGEAIWFGLILLLNENCSALFIRFKVPQSSSLRTYVATTASEKKILKLTILDEILYIFNTFHCGFFQLQTVIRDEEQGTPVKFFWAEVRVPQYVQQLEPLATRTIFFFLFYLSAASFKINSSFCSPCTQ